MADLDPDRARSTSHIRRSIARLRAVIADNQAIAELFPWRGAAERKRVRQAHMELQRAEFELANLLRA